jgi:hypothetical protein
MTRSCRAVDTGAAGRAILSAQIRMRIHRPEEVRRCAKPPLEGAPRGA